MGEYQFDFISRYQNLFHIYRNFPLPVVICNDRWKVHFSNDLANHYYNGVTTTQGLAALLGEFDRDALLREAVETGNCTIREIMPPSSVNLSITPILEGDKPAGLVLIFVRMDNYVDSKVYYQGTRMAGVLADGIREVVGEIFSAMDAVYLKADLMNMAWMQDGFNAVSTNSYRILRVASNLTEYARYQSGLLNLRTEETDLTFLLEGSREATGAIAAAMDTPVRFKLPKRNIYVALDRPRFEAAYYNVLHNALFYAGKGNQIEVSLSVKEQKALLTVADKGLGIPANILPDVTRPYFVYEHGAPTGNAGLGLAIARLMAESHSGTLAIRSREGVGTAVTFSLPLSEGAGPLRLKQTTAQGGLTDRFAPVYTGLMDAALSPYRKD